MTPKRLSIRISPDLYRRLTKEASLDGKTESEIVREALEAYLAARPSRESAYDAFRRLGLIGMIKHAPPDMSTNRKYFRNFGRK